ncbi:hypothetical protein ZOSMA_4G00760 [Zostera marina]|uniref:Uncharacterized protein n=1 Tax=Zostera marina TaxID=29655 RepID=A0A0K9P0M8_ZOSMR|nr:hypothetical protein ZOSMA_4G00760 [Zostera marina]
MVQTVFLGNLRPNMVMLSYPEIWRRKNLTEIPSTFVSIINDCIVANEGIVIIKGLDEWPGEYQRQSGTRSTLEMELKPLDTTTTSTNSNSHDALFMRFGETTDFGVGPYSIGDFARFENEGHNQFTPLSSVVRHVCYPWRMCELKQLQQRCEWRRRDGAGVNG